MEAAMLSDALREARLHLKESAALVPEGFMLTLHVFETEARDLEGRVAVQADILKQLLLPEGTKSHD
jgi:hypothetical protein